MSAVSLVSCEMIRFLFLDFESYVYFAGRVLSVSLFRLQWLLKNCCSQVNFIAFQVKYSLCKRMWSEKMEFRCKLVNSKLPLDSEITTTGHIQGNEKAFAFSFLPFFLANTTITFFMVILILWSKRPSCSFFVHVPNFFSKIRRIKILLLTILPDVLCTSSSFIGSFQSEDTFMSCVLMCLKWRLNLFTWVKIGVVVVRESVPSNGPCAYFIKANNCDLLLLNSLSLSLRFFFICLVSLV